jgi:hypothetical protein
VHHKHRCDPGNPILIQFGHDFDKLICQKSTRTDFQNMKFIEWFLTEVQVKHWCIVGWEYTTAAKYDLAVVHPKVICF